MNRPEAKRFRVKLTNLNIPKIDLVDVFIDLLEAENRCQAGRARAESLLGLMQELF